MVMGYEMTLGESKTLQAGVMQINEGALYQLYATGSWACSAAESSK